MRLIRRLSWPTIDVKSRGTACRARRVRKGRGVMHSLGCFAAECRTDPGDGAAKALSSVVQRLQPSKTVALSDLAKSMKENGKDVISLAVGEPDFPTPDPVVEAAAAAMRAGHTKYTQNAGLSTLRAAICEKLKRENGLDYTEDCVVVSNGAKQAAWQGIVATCSQGDEVLIPAPYWVSYPEMVAMAGAEPKILPCPISDGFLLNPAILKEALTERSRLLILCSPSNPTGAMYTRVQLESIADVVRSHPRLLIMSDEIYEYMAYAPAEHVSFAALAGMHERTLTVNGFSKGFAMTGWRVGYLAAAPEFARACATVQSHVTSCPSSISQHAAVAALKMGNKGGPVIQQMIQNYQQRRDYVLQRLRAMPDVNVLQPDGAFYVFPDVSAFLDGSVDTTEALSFHLLREALVATVPGEAFGAPGHLRLSYAASTAEIREALNRLEHALQKRRL